MTSKIFVLAACLSAVVGICSALNCYTGALGATTTIACSTVCANMTAGVSAISGTTYSCAGTTQTVGCTTTTGTNTCYCNTDLCNKSGGIRSQNVDLFALSVMTIASLIVSFKFL